MKRALIAFAFTLTAAAGARADVIPADVEACRSRQIGDACTQDGKSTCQTTTCTQIDYAGWTNRDGGPPSKQVDCVKCAPKGKLVATDAGAAPKGDEAGDSSGCSVGGVAAAARPAGPWLLAGAFSALFLVRRRRR
jgi:hypothetical protein